MDIIIKPLTEELAEDYFDFLDNRAFTDNSPWGGCYCTAWQMTKEEEKVQLFDNDKARRQSCYEERIIITRAQHKYNGRMLTQ